MRKAAIALFIGLLTYSSNAFSQYEGTVGMGIHAEYGKNTPSIGGGVHIHYYCTNSIRLASSYSHYIPAKGNRLWRVDADAHFILPITWLLSTYPIAGLNYSNRQFDASKTSDIVANTRRKQRLGANLGLGLQYDFGYKVRASIEYKYQFVKDFSQSIVSLGVGFWI